MSFIEFESGREKDRMREELRQARNDLLKKVSASKFVIILTFLEYCYPLQAEERSKARDEHQLQKKLRGDDQWMLPSISKKLEANEEVLKKSMKKKKKKKQRRKSSDSSSAEEIIKHKKRKKRSYSSESSRSSVSDETSDDEWIEKKASVVPVSKPSTEPLSKPAEREDWLSGMLIPTFSNKEKDTKKDDRNTASYDPKTSGRELNPFWKDGGNGMPTFQKPKSDSDDDNGVSSNYNRRREIGHRTSGWRKHKDNDRSTQYVSSAERSYRRSNSRDRSRKRSSSRDRSRKRPSSRDKSLERNKRQYGNPKQRSRSQTPEYQQNRSRKRSPSEREKKRERSKTPPPKNETITDKQSEHSSNRADFLTDQQMNELGAKILKAEILGNDELANELKQKLEKAREYRNGHKSEILAKDRAAKNNTSKEEEFVMLTTTNRQGVTKPLARQTKESDLWGGRAGRKKNKKVETHSGGERVRYFADDDKYDIKQMVSLYTHCHDTEYNLL